MRKIISALIIDENKENRDYSDIITDNLDNSFEKKIEIFSVTSTENILNTLNKYKGIDAIITIGDNLDFHPLNNLSFEFRKKWTHFTDYNPKKISDAIVSTFLMNINRDKKGSELFSVFTCTFNTSKSMLLRLYNSLCSQTYHNWNWWILDDSTIVGSVCDYIEKLHDPRITVIKNVSNHGNIGFNKHVIASICDGDYLVEVDHDDELTSNCLEMLKKAFDTYNDCDFVYSYVIEEMDGEPITYDDGRFALGQAKNATHKVDGIDYYISETADVNPLTVRHIVGLPNHVRCWKKEFYHKIGGHNTDLSILDDMDILIRTFLYGKMCKIPEILYIQHEGSSKDAKGRGSTTQGARLPEIRRIGVYLKNKYDLLIHKRLKELGIEDKIWEGNDDDGYSKLQITNEEFDKVNYILNK